MDILMDTLLVVVVVIVVAALWVAFETFWARHVL